MMRLISALVAWAPEGALDRLSGASAAHAAEVHASSLGMEASGLCPPEALGGWEGPGVFAAMVVWCIDYPHNDMFHRCFERIVRAALLCNHRATIERLIIGCRLVPVMFNLAFGEQARTTASVGSGASGGVAADVLTRAARQRSTPGRAMAIRILAMLRLSLQARPVTGDWLRTLLSTHHTWAERQPELEAALEFQRQTSIPRPNNSPNAIDSMAGVAPAVRRLLLAMSRAQPDPAAELRETSERQKRSSINLGGLMAEELGFADVSAWTEPASSSTSTGAGSASGATAPATAGVARPSGAPHAGSPSASQAAAPPRPPSAGAASAVVSSAAGSPASSPEGSSGGASKKSKKSKKHKKKRKTGKTAAGVPGGIKSNGNPAPAGDDSDSGGDDDGDKDESSSGEGRLAMDAVD